MTDTVVNGIKLVAEAVFAPGSSLLMDGNVKTGALHLVGGLAAKSAIGPAGWALAAANSFSVSVSGQHLHEHIASSWKDWRATKEVDETEVTEVTKDEKTSKKP